MRNKLFSRWITRGFWLTLAALLLSMAAGSKIGLASSSPAVSGNQFADFSSTVGSGQAQSLTDNVPGAQIFSSSGQLSSPETHTPTYPLSSATEVNLKLHVPAVAGDGAISLEFTDGAGANTFNGDIRDGETLWTTLTLKPGNNQFKLSNGSGLTLDYELWVYEAPNAPYNWSGASQGAGTWRSHIRLNFPSGGLYRFDFGKASGRYQFLVNDKYIQKTVEANGAVNYYVPAGVHDLYIEPDSASANTSWSLNISGPVAAADTLPYTKSGGNLKDTVFGKEWLPVNLAGAASVNFKLKLTGASADTLDVHLYGATGDTPIQSVTDVCGGETLWWNGDLATGLSRVQLVAAPGNSGVLAYELTINGKPTVPATWAGRSDKAGNNSAVRFQVATAGLYEFTFDVTGGGRYQFLIASNPLIQKTVETSGTVRYYLTEGAHELTVVQDTAQGAEWSLAIADTGQSHDALPYHKSGGNLGGAGNDFSEERLPLNVAAGSPANFELTLAGDLADGLRAYLYHGETPVYTTPVVYGGETFWWVTDLAAGENHVKLAAGAGNNASLTYDLTLHSLPTVAENAPYTWRGLSKGAPAPVGNSEVKMQMPVDGTYHVIMDIPNGFATVNLPMTMATSQATVQSRSEFDLSLDKGGHLFTVQQSDAYITTTWTITVSLKEANTQNIYLPAVLK